MMFERGICGGISHISKRYTEANNKYMTDYNADEESTYIQYLEQIIFMDGQCHNHFQHMVLNG